MRLLSNIMFLIIYMQVGKACRFSYLALADLLTSQLTLISRCHHNCASISTNPSLQVVSVYLIPNWFGTNAKNPSDPSDFSDVEYIREVGECGPNSLCWNH